MGSLPLVFPGGTRLEFHQRVLRLALLLIGLGFAGGCESTYWVQQDNATRVLLGPHPAPDVVPALRPDGTRVSLRTKAVVGLSQGAVDAPPEPGEFRVPVRTRSPYRKHVIGFGAAGGVLLVGGLVLIAVPCSDFGCSLGRLAGASSLGAFGLTSLIVTSALALAGIHSAEQRGAASQ